MRAVCSVWVVLLGDMSVVCGKVSMRNWRRSRVGLPDRGEDGVDGRQVTVWFGPSVFTCAHIRACYFRCCFVYCASRLHASLSWRVRAAVEMGACQAIRTFLFGTGRINICLSKPHPRKPLGRHTHQPSAKHLPLATYPALAGWGPFLLPHPHLLTKCVLPCGDDCGAVTSFEKKISWGASLGIGEKN